MLFALKFSFEIMVIEGKQANLETENNLSCSFMYQLIQFLYLFIDLLLLQTNYHLLGARECTWYRTTDKHACVVIGTKITGHVKYWDEENNKIQWLLTSFVQFFPLDVLNWLQISDCLLLKVKVGDAIKWSQ